MAHRVAWNIATPMISLGVFLLGVGILAAWNVHEQQQTSSELMLREVNGMLAIDELNVAMREIRYQLNLFLRTHDANYLKAVSNLNAETNGLVARAKELARTSREKEVLAVMEEGYLEFFKQFAIASGPLIDRPLEKATGDGEPVIVLVSPQQGQVLADLAEHLTKKVLQPLRECLAVNQQVVELTNRTSQETARHLKIGFVLLGLCGASAGILLGTGVARAVSRSIIQLDISVRDAAGRLADVVAPVTFANMGDLAGLETSLRKVQNNISEVVQRLQKRETELLRSEQLALVGQLAAGLAHEIRNPLMPMKTLVQAALAKGDDAGLKGRSLFIINEEISRMERSLQVFLDFARPPEPEKRIVAIDEVVKTTLALVRIRAEQQNIDLGLSLPVERVFARVDAAQIRQLLLNMILNAFDALPQGGRVDVAVEMLVPSHQESHEDNSQFASEHDAIRMIGQSHVSTGSESRELAIRVSDSGTGIPESHLQSIFEPFVSTKETGLGLGLSICRHIASVHSGTLVANNLAKGGAEFVFRMPLEQEEVP